MTATFALHTPRTGDLVAVAPGQTVTTPAGDRTWKAAFRMRVTEVSTPAEQRRTGLVIVGGVVINKDGSDRMRAGKLVECALTFTADRVTLDTPAQPTDAALDAAYARQARTKRDQDAPVNLPASPDQGAYVPGPMPADVDRALVARMEANAARTADQTANAFMDLAGERVTVQWITHWGPVTLPGGADDHALAFGTRPVIKAEDGFVDDVSVASDAVTVTLTYVTDGERDAWSRTVRLVGSDHPMGGATPYVIDVHQGDQGDTEAAPVSTLPAVTHATVIDALARSVSDAVDQAEAEAEAAPVAVPVVVDVMADARTLTHGDHVSGMTSDRRPFGGYVCGAPTAGRDRHGNTAVIIRLASAPVDGRGTPVAVTGRARFSRLPIDPRVIAQGEALSAMAALRRAGYTVKAARCHIPADHHAHLYRADGTPARTRLVCGGAAQDPADVIGFPVPVDAPAAPVQAAPVAPVVPVTPPAPVQAVPVPAMAPVAPVQAPTFVPPVATVAPVTTESEAPVPASVPATEAPAEAAPVPAGRLVATVDRAALIEVLAHAVKVSPVKSAPEYAAVTIAADGRYAVTVTARGWDAVMTTSVNASVAVAGSVMINARALVKLIRATPAPKGRKAAPTMVTLAHQGDQVTVTAGATALVADAVCSTLNLGPVPTVPVVPVQTATVDAFTEAVTRVTPFAGTDETMRNLMGVQVTTTADGSRVLMAATDRYRASDVTMPVRYRLDADTDAREHVDPGLVPAEFLSLVATVAGKSGAASVDMTTFTVGGERWFGYRVGRYTFALRAIDGLMGPIRSLFPADTSAHVSVNAGDLVAMIERVATVDTGAPGAMRLTVSADSVGNVTGITAYLLRNSAHESMPATGHCADGFSFGVTPAYLCTALTIAVPGEATMSLVDNRKPITVRGASDRYRALIMPVRLDGSTVDDAAPAPVAAPVAAPVVASAPVAIPAVPVPSAPVPTPAAPVVTPVDVRTADQVTAAGGALVTVHGVNGHRSPITLTGRVKHVTPCTTGRVAGLVRVQLDTGRTIYVSVTATTEGTEMTAKTTKTTKASKTPASTDTRNLPAEKRAGDAFTHATDGNYADARTAMAEAAGMVPAGYRFGGKYTATQISALIDAHEATGAFSGVLATQPTSAPAPAPVQAAPVAVVAPVADVTEAPAEAAPTVDQGDADADMPARLRDALSRVTWQGATVDGRSVDLMVLPRVSRAVYLAIKAVVEPIGGTYTRKHGARPGGFAFAPSRVIHGGNDWTATGREKVAAWLAGADVPADPADVAEAAPVSVPVVAPVQAEAAPVSVAAPVQLPAATDVEAAYRAGYADALASLTAGGATPAPVSAPAVPLVAPVASESVTYTLPDYDTSGEVYGVSVAAIADRLTGHPGVTVKRVARKGPGRRQFTVTGPASAHAVAVAYVKALESRTVDA